MEQFYSWCRGENGIGFYPRQGTRVYNNFGLILFAYHSDETYEKDKSWWYIVEQYSGLAIGRGHTRAEAVQNTITAINTRGINSIKNSIRDTVEKHGWPPGVEPDFI